MITDRDRQSFRLLGGVQEVTPDMGSRLNEVHGMLDREAGSLRRLFGKLLSSTGPGRVWTIHQTVFRSRRSVVLHVASTYIAIDDPSCPPGTVVLPASSVGYNFGADWLNTPPIVPGNWLPPEGPGAVGPEADRV